ncbi:hypothetical protein GWK47_021973 [Chionoecetes opilio]|uniref:THAP-type domain-containing protein n=1 Tax=Chionoecetes opilio TaxID=41210 RepID=A0A8J5CKC6_CHIOP|nr:hypothetical protein GWK47_021973 [Chionoecetes opilio]
MGGKCDHHCPVSFKHRIRTYLLGRDASLLGAKYNVLPHINATNLTEASFTAVFSVEQEKEDTLQNELNLTAMIFATVMHSDDRKENDPENCDTDDHSINLEDAIKEEGELYLGGYIAHKFPEYKLGSNVRKGEQTSMCHVLSWNNASLMLPSTEFLLKLKVMGKIFICHHGENTLKPGKNAMQELSALMYKNVDLPQEGITFYVYSNDAALKLRPLRVGLLGNVYFGERYTSRSPPRVLNYGKRKAKGERETDYARNLKYELLNLPLPRHLQKLKPTAVPTLLLPQPEHPGLRNKWIQACGAIGVNQHARICSLHFKTSDYEKITRRYDLLQIPVPKSQRQLKASVVPTLILPTIQADEELRAKWIEISGAAKNRKTGRICSRHFESSAFERNLKYELLGIPVPPWHSRFKPGTVPTLHLHNIEDIASRAEEDDVEVEEGPLQQPLYQEFKEEDMDDTQPLYQEFKAEDEEDPLQQPLCQGFPEEDPLQQPIYQGLKEEARTHYNSHYTRGSQRRTHYNSHYTRGSQRRTHYNSHYTRGSQRRTHYTKGSQRRTHYSSHYTRGSQRRTRRTHYTKGSQRRTHYTKGSQRRTHYNSHYTKGSQRRTHYNSPYTKGSKRRKRILLVWSKRRWMIHSRSHQSRPPQTLQTVDPFKESLFDYRPPCN